MILGSTFVTDTQNCSSSQTLEITNSLCYFKSSCRLKVEADSFAKDSCSSGDPKLFIEYECIPRIALKSNHISCHSSTESGIDEVRIDQLDFFV